MSLKRLLGLDTSSVRVGGKTLTIKPMTVRQAFVVEEAFRPIADGIVEHGADSPHAYAPHGPLLIKLVAEMCSESEAWVGDLRPADFNKLLAKVLDVERDFFRDLVRQAARTRSKQSPIPGKKPSSA